MTAFVVDDAQRARETVRQDLWDREAFATTDADLDGRLSAVAARLDGIVQHAGDLVPDLFSLFHKQAPRVKDEAEVAPSHLLNRAIVRHVAEASATREARALTIDDPVASAFATVAARDTVGRVVERLGDVRERAERAQAAQDAVDEMERRLDDDSAEPVDLAELEQLRSEAQAARRDAQDAVDGADAIIGRYARQAAQEALDSAEQGEEAAVAFGLDAGEVCRVDPKRRAEMAQRLASPRMRKIAEIVGAMHNLAVTARQRKPRPRESELHDVTLGDHLARVLPAEFLGLTHPLLKLDFYRRYTERQLLEYELRDHRPQGKGAIVVLQDCSGSMDGARLDWATAFSVALCAIAKKEGRRFEHIAFRGRGAPLEVVRMGPDSYPPESLFDIASRGASGGTDFETALDAGVQSLRDEFDATGLVTGDIVLVSDGESQVGDEFLRNLHAEAERLQFRIFGVSVESDGGPVMDAVCSGRVVNLYDLASGGDVRAIIEALV